MTAVFLSKSQTSSKMKTQSPAPIGVDPIRSFLKKLPQKAAVLGMKGLRSSGRESVEVRYSYRNRIINTSLSWEGGAK
jgi:hypothetical protein